MTDLNKPPMFSSPNFDDLIKQRQEMLKYMENKKKMKQNKNNTSRQFTMEDYITGKI